MATGKDGAVVRQLRTLFHVGTAGELTDGQLLERFATVRNEAAELAFAVLVERHGPMVLRVCRGVLADPHDAQDAFQATFLVLIRKARGLWVRDSLGPWLHQVAHRTASCARRAEARRRRLERRAAVPASDGRAEAGDELARAIHQEIDRLPGRYRAPLILCDLEGRTHEQAARHLGWPIGTVKSRLARGRQRLRDRLVRRGLAPDAGLLAAAPRRDGINILVPPALVDATTRSAVQFVTARAIVPGSVASLAQEVLRPMFLAQWLKVASVAVALGASASGVGWLAQRGNPGLGARSEGKPQANRAEDRPAVAVRPGKLSVVVSERGNVQADRGGDVFCKVEQGTSIRMILPEGRAVKKGDLVCELDSSGLRDQLVNQEITTKGAEANFQNARLARKTAEVAITEYEEGIFKSEWMTLQGEIKLAEADLEIAQEDLGALKTSHPPAKPPAIKKAERDLLRARLALERAQTRKMVLEKYTKPKTAGKLHEDVERAFSDEMARQATWELERSKQKWLEEQIAHCKLYAPNDGPVVYADEPNRTGPSQRTTIEEGAAVRERQKIFSVPDLGQLEINTKVHESWVDRLRDGQPARIRVDAFADKVFIGKVESVNPRPDPVGPSGSGVRVYTARVSIDDKQPGLRPGMTAQVEILVKELDDVLSVPVSAVLSYDGKDYVWVKKPGGGFESREVTLGASSDKAVEVQQGLKPGELVIQDPRALLGEQGPRGKKLGAPTPPAPP